MSQTFHIFYFIKDQHDSSKKKTDKNNARFLFHLYLYFKLLVVTSHLIYIIIHRQVKKAVSVLKGSGWKFTKLRWQICNIFYILKVILQSIYLLKNRYFMICTVVNITLLMLSASKSTVNLKNLKILKPKVTKNVTNLPKKVCEFRPCSFYGPFLFLARNLEVIQRESDNTANHWYSTSRKKLVHCSICGR